MSALLRLPLIVILMGLGALSMAVPGIMALAVDDIALARPFLYGMALFSVLSGLAALATGNRAPGTTGRSHLLALVMAYLGLPLMLALPMAEADPRIDLAMAYVDMVSCLTTTGARLVPDDIAPVLAFWRAQVGWMGGLMIWITAFGILAPMTLGGFEVTSAQEAGRGAARREIGNPADPTRRLVRYSVQLTPVYVGLTVGLAILLSMAGAPPIAAMSHAMSTLSTSGISILPIDQGGPAGRWGEAMVLAFLVFAITRKSFVQPRWPVLRRDRELRVALFLVGGGALLVVLRAVLTGQGGQVDPPFQVLAVAWGAVFTAASFLTTTGFVSQDWPMADGAGLAGPGLLLAGLALLGGGVATTAGGVKLLRVYALYKHGTQEMAHMIHPHSVAGGKRIERRIRTEGAAVAWVFFMLFALSAAAVMVLFTLSGVDFAGAVILGVAALTNTGPLTEMVNAAPLGMADLGAGAKIVLTGAMVLGRLEALAIIALINPALWRD